jgi:hypothetical protein
MQRPESHIKINLLFEGITVNFPTNPLSIAAKDEAHSALHTTSSILEHALDSFVQFTHVHLSASKANLHGSVSLVRQVLDSHDTRKVYQAIQSEIQPSLVKTVSYGRDLLKLSIEAQTRIAEVIHSRVNQTSTQFHALTTDLTKVSPSGTEHYTDVVKIGVSTWHKAIEKFAESQISMLKNYSAHLDTYGNLKSQKTQPQPQKPKKSVLAEEAEA